MPNKYSRLYDKACGQFDTSFRELFDYLSDEYNCKNDDYRLEKLKEVVKESYSLPALIEGYKYHYLKNEEKSYVIEEIGPSMILILKHAAAALGDDPATRQEIGQLESAMVFNRLDEQVLIDKLLEVIRRINKIPAVKTVTPKKKKPVVKSSVNDEML